VRKPLPNALDIDLAGVLTEAVTPHVGVALLIELGRRSGVMAAADKRLPPKKSAKGLGQNQMVEPFVLVSALGGDCIDDFEGLRRNYGLQALGGAGSDGGEGGEKLDKGGSSLPERGGRLSQVRAFRLAGSSIHLQRKRGAKRWGKGVWVAIHKRRFRCRHCRKLFLGPDPARGP